MRPGRVLHLLHRGALAGTERHVLGLVGGLIERGWDVMVAVSHSGPACESFARKGVPVLRQPRLLGPDPAYLVGLVRTLRKRRVDILHAHSGRFPCLAGRLAGSRLLVETRHGLGFPLVAGSNRRLKMQAALCRLSHRTITVCESDRRALIRGGLAPERVVCIPNGIPPRSRVRERQRGDVIRLGFLGRMVPQKDPLFLVEVLKSLRAILPHGWVFRAAGDGPLRDAFQRGLEAVCPPGALAWMGEVEDGGAFMDDVDLLLAPSRWEGQPLALLEAMQSGAVVLASQIEALGELVGGEPPAGLLLPREPGPWARAIERLSRDPDLRLRMAAEGRSRVALRHGLDATVRGVEELYLEAFPGRPAR